jgi:hypothetical protein
MSVVYDSLEGGLRLGHLDTYDNEENESLKTFAQGDDISAVLDSRRDLYTTTLGGNELHSNPHPHVLSKSTRDRTASKTTVCHHEYLVYILGQTTVRKSTYAIIHSVIYDKSQF